MKWVIAGYILLAIIMYAWAFGLFVSGKPYKNKKKK